MKDFENTTIVITKRNRDRLASMGGKDDSFNEVLDRILSIVEEQMAKK